MLTDYAKHGRLSKNNIIAGYQLEVAIENGYPSWTRAMMDNMGSILILNLFEEVALRCLNHKK